MDVSHCLLTIVSLIRDEVVLIQTGGLPMQGVSQRMAPGVQDSFRCERTARRIGQAGIGPLPDSPRERKFRHFKILRGFDHSLQHCPVAGV